MLRVGTSYVYAPRADARRRFGAEPARSDLVGGVVSERAPRYGSTGCGVPLPSGQLTCVACTPAALARFVHWNFSPGFLTSRLPTPCMGGGRASFEPCLSASRAASTRFFASGVYRSRYPTNFILPPSQLNT